MNKEEILARLWEGYIAITPSAKKVYDLFNDRVEGEVENDHIAIRTFNDPRVNIDVLAKPFLAAGYEPCGEYEFKAKKLFARHFQHATDTKAPKIFISELKLEEISIEAQRIIKTTLDAVDNTVFEDKDLLFKGRVWGQPSYTIYETLRAESEYAAWMYICGFCANHFTVFVNQFEQFKGLEEVNEFVKEQGFKMNTSGGEIKGTPAQLLEQSSILADTTEIEFIEGKNTVTTCYYEFARRYTAENGEIYNGFIAASADKIFESTDLVQQ